MTTRWAPMWRQHDDAYILWESGLPKLFLTRAAAREWIEERYGYIRNRTDLQKPPHNWRMPKAVRVEVILEPARKIRGEK